MFCAVALRSLCKAHTPIKTVSEHDQITHMWIVIIFIISLAFVYQFFFIEQLFVYLNENQARANYAKWVLDGAPKEYGAAVISSHKGVPLFFAFFLVPLFFFFGTTPLSFFVFFIFIQLVTIIVLYIFAARHFSRDIAAISAFLLALRVPSINFSYYSQDCGVHSDTALFSLLVLFLFFEYFFSTDPNPTNCVSGPGVQKTGFQDPANKPHAVFKSCPNTVQQQIVTKNNALRVVLFYACAGLIAGFSIFVCYTNGIVVITLLLFCLISRLFLVEWKGIFVFTLIFCSLILFLTKDGGLYVNSHVDGNGLFLYMSFLLLRKNRFGYRRFLSHGIY